MTRPNTSFITNHAMLRWKERFGVESITTALRRAVPFGAHFKGHPQKLMIDMETEAVFVIKRGVVKTVLTKEMAISSQQTFFRDARRCDFVDKGKLDAIDEQVKSLAERHVRENGAIVCEGAIRLNGAYKPRLKELRAIVPLEARDYEKYLAVYYRTITAIGREWIKKQSEGKS